MRALNRNRCSDFAKLVVAIGAFERKPKALKTFSLRFFPTLSKVGTNGGVRSVRRAENRVCQS